MVKIKVCRSCGWSNDKIRRELKRLQSEHKDEVRVTRKGCMDRCKKDPVVSVSKTTLAPARVKKLRSVVERELSDV